MNVAEALAAQAIGSLDRQLGNAVRFAKSHGKVIALSPMTISRRPRADPRLPHVISLSHEYLELKPDQPPPPGWVIVDGEEA